MNKNNLPNKSCSHIATGTWFVSKSNSEVLRLHSNALGKQTVYVNEEKVGNFRNLKSSFEYDFEKNGHSYSIKMKTESHTKTENITTFHKDQSIVKVFKSSFKFTAKQISTVIIPIIIITLVTTIKDISTLIQYACVFTWLIIAILITGKDYLQITESDNPNFG